MNHTATVRRLAAFGFAITAIASTAACAVPEEEDEVVGTDEAAVTYCPTCDDPKNDGPAGYCPIGMTTYQKSQLQKKVTTALRYALGGAAPTVCTNGTSLATAGSGIARLQNLIESGKCNIYSAHSDDVCGVDAAVHPLYCSNLTSIQYYALRALSGDVDDCWGQGAAGFISTSTTNGGRRSDGTYWLNMEIDPEPAQTTQPLWGSNGASAAAVYVNSNAGTSVVKLGSSYSSSYSYLAAGTPCSTVNLYDGATTLKVVQAMGTLRKCL